MKRFTKLLLTMAMLVGVSLSTFAERFSYTFAGQTVYYERTENYTARVDYCPVTVSGGVAIPDEVAYYGTVWGPVTAVASYAFEDCINITAVSLPASVTSIGAYAFKNCTSLTSVMLTASNERVDFSLYAFDGCSDEVYNSYDNAFYIGTGANPYLYLMKAASTNITSCQIHPDCKYINGDAFRNCDKLTEISIPNTITYIGGHAFDGCTSLTSIIIPGSVTEISGSAFKGCSSLASLTLNSGVTTIGYQAFNGCSSLTTVTVPRSVTSIGSAAFGGCSALESITLPFVGSAAITSIDVDRYPFGYIFGTTSFEGAVETKQYYKKAGEGSSRSVVYYIPSLLKTVTIDVAAANDVAIMENAFINCTELTSVSLNQVTSIEKYAFEGCTSLTTITVPQSVTSIARGAFRGCMALETMTLPFPGTQKYTPDMVETELSENNGALANGNTGLECGFLFGTIFQSGNWDPDKLPSTLRTVTFTNCEYLPYNTFHHNANYSDWNITSVTLPNNLITIGEKAFSNCPGLTSVTIPSNVTTVGENAYEGCASVTSITTGCTVDLSATKLTFSKDGFNYRVLNKSTVELTGSSNTTGTVTIPATVTCGNTFTVISIAEYAFGNGFSNVNLISVPETVSTIGSHAFSNVPLLFYTGTAEGSPWGALALCHVIDEDFAYSDAEKTQLVGYLGTGGDVVVPNTVTEIHPATFKNCVGLTSVKIPSSVTSISGSAFSGCTNLTKVTLNNNAIASKAYTSSSNFKTIFGSQVEEYVLGEDVTSIGDYAFYGCTSLTSITIPEIVTSIGEHAFWGCTGLISITIPEDVISIGESAFNGCTGLTSVTIPKNVTSIGAYAFSNCSNAQEFVFEGETPPTFGGSYLFEDSTCPIYVPNASAVTAYKAAVGSRYASRVTIMPVTIIVDGIKYDLQNDGTFAVVANNYSDEIIIPSSIDYNGVATAVTSIAANAFENCVGLTTVTIPSSVTSIESDAFSGCTNLTKVTLNSNAIASKTYTSSSNLTTIFGSQVEEYVLGEDVASIGSYAFYGCTGLPSVTIPSNVTSVGGSAFGGCTNLTKVTINSNAVASKTYTSSSSFKTIFGTQVTEYVLGEDVTSIGGYAFNGCTGLTSITIPEGVTSIGGSAFDGCTNLTSIHIPEGVTEIGGYAFNRCTGLTSVTIPSSVTTIVGSAFYYCDNLKKVTINSNAIASKTYTYNSNLGNIFGQQVTEYVLGDDVTSIGEYAFDACTGLTSVTIPEGITSIGGSAFYSCTGLTSITIPEGITTIDDHTFYNCKKLTSITIPENVTSIGNSAFEDCKNVQMFVFERETPPAFGSDVFKNSTCPIYVPNISAVTAYKAADNMNSYESRVTIVPTFVVVDGVKYQLQDDETFAVVANNYSGEIVIRDSVEYNGVATVVSSIAENVFRNCTGLTSVTIPNTITSIRNDEFSGCTNLTKVILNSNAIASKGYLSSLNLGTKFGQQVTEYVLGENVTSIGGFAFYDCTGLTKISIPKTVTTVGAYAFENCTGLTAIYIEGDADFSNTELEFEHDGFKYRVLTKNTVAVLANSYSGDVVIPETVTFGNTFTVKVIVADAFSNCTDLTSISIPETVTDLGSFKNCTNLTSITIPESVTTISRNAFSGCDNLETVICNSNNGNFSEITSLKTAILGNSVTTLPSFYQCTNLSSITIPESVTEIGNKQLYYCKSLPSLTIPKSVTTIGNEAFYGCSNLQEIIFEKETPPTFGSSVFSGSSCPIYVPNASAVTAYKAAENMDWYASRVKIMPATLIVDGITYELQNDGTFAVVANNNSGDVVIRESVDFNGVATAVTSIAANAFKDCTDLTAVTIPSSVTSIESDAFNGCTNLTKVTINSNALASKTHTSGSNFKTIFGSQVTEYVLGEEVTKIGDYAFYNYSGLKSVTIPEGVTSIGERAFRDCIGLTSINIPEAVTSIGSYAFYDCSGLKSVTIPEGVPSIGEYTFYYCSGLTSITIPESVRSIGNYAFYHCSNAQEFVLEGETPPTFGNYVFEDSSCPIYVPTADAVTAYKAKENMSSYASRVTIMPTFVVVDGVKYQLQDDGTFAVVANNYSGEVNTIRESIDYNGVATAVTSIASSAFKDCTDLTAVTIPSSITLIMGDAFTGCTNLTKVTINSNTIASKTYTSSYNLGTIFGQQVTEYVLDEGLTSIGGYAFYDCTGLTSITIPENVTSIGVSAFLGCTGLKSVTIPEGVTSIGGSAFHVCTGLTSVTIPESVTEMGYGVFYNCSNLQEVVFEGETPPTFGTFMFYGTSCPIYVPTEDAVTAYKKAENMSGYASRVKIIPTYVVVDGIRYLLKDDGTFAVVANNYSGDVVIPSSIDYNGEETAVTSIGKRAFYNCEGLTSITIPESITSIDDNAFTGCTGLTSIIINSDASSSFRYSAGLYFIKDGIKYHVLDKDNVSVVANSYSGEVVIPDSVTFGNTFKITSIESKAFDGCTDLTKVTLNSNAIASKKYTNSYNLGTIFGQQVTEYVLGETVTSIGEYAFYGCANMTSVTIPENVTSIGYYAFYNCSGLSSVTIPDGVTSINNDVFSGCTGLTSVTIPEGVTEIARYAFKGCTGLTEVTIPSNITSINGDAFNGCSNLTKVTLNSNAIASWSYTSSYNLGSKFGTQVTEYVLGESVTSIGNNAFYGCANLTSVTIPEGVTSINYSAFYDCTGLTSITIPESVTSIGYYVFQGCTGLTSVTINSDADLGDAYLYIIKDGIKYNVLDKNSVKVVSNSYSGNVEIPQTIIAGNTFNVTTIDGYAFYNCTDLTSVTIPESVTSIGYAAFENCSSAQEFVFEGETPPTVGNYVFYGSSCPIYVPNASAVTAYKSANNMSNYASRVQVMPIYTIDVVANNDEYGTVSGSGTYDARITPTVTISATAVEPYQFAYWNEDGSTEATRTIILYQNATYTAVFKRAVTISNITVSEKVYDGTTSAQINYTTEGILEGDDVTVTCTASFDDENVGEEKTVTLHFELEGEDASNYAIAAETTELKSAITAYTSVEVTITENGGTETYDGTEKMVTGYVVEINTDLYTESDFTFSGTAEVKGTNAGTYEMNIVASDFENINDNFANVTFTVVDGTLEIEKSTETPNMPEVTAETRLLNITDVALPEGWAWADETIALVEGENSAVANYMGDDADNYTIKSVTITITRLPCLHDGEYTVVDAQEATCLADGYTGDHKCSICGVIFEQGSVIPAEGHKAGEPVIENYTAPTCKEAGSVDTVYYCTIDGEEISRETYVLPIVDHVPGKKVAENIVPATTTTEGSVDSVVYCMVGGEELSREHFVLPVLDHEHIAGEPVEENRIEPTCLVDGSVDTVVYCTVNGEELSREHYVLPATGHIAGEPVIENYVAPTCTEAGTVDTLYYCTIDGDLISRETYALEAKGHLPSEKVAKNYVAPTCLVDGSVDSVVTCTVCGEVLSEEHFVLPATGHIAGEPVIENYVAPTCTEAGTVDTVYYCIVDGDLISRETYVLPILDHVPGKKVAENIIPATTTAEGSVDSVVYCMVGGEELSREHFVLPVLDHEHIAGEPVEENRTEPTCLVDGSVDTVVYCTVNGEELSREHYVLPATGHIVGEPVIENYTAPTCTETGSVDTVYYCTIDGEEISRETYVLPILDHVPGEKVAENIIPATTTTEGSVDSVVYCMVGGEELSREHFVLPILDHEHIAGTPVVENYVAPTFTTEGSVDSVVYCTVCGEELSRETFTLPMLQKAIEKIEILSMPKTEYIVGEDIDISGARIAVTFNDGSVEEIDLTNEMLSGFDNTLVAEQEITITYLTFTTTIKVTVKDEGTAISDVAGDETVIYAYGHTIVVKTANTGDIIVNDMNGRIIAKSQSNGDRTEIYVPKVGVYAVRIGTVSQKVVIR